MTQRQFYAVSESAYAYVNKRVEFLEFVPSLGKKVQKEGIILGIGAGPNLNNLIIGLMGSLKAIYFRDVKMPK